MVLKVRWRGWFNGSVFGGSVFGNVFRAANAPEKDAVALIVLDKGGYGKSGKGFGKKVGAPIGRCFQCGGLHFKSECPQLNGKGARYLSDWMPPPALTCRIALD